MLSLGACANLSSVTEFANLSSSVTSSTGALDSYTSAASELARMASPANLAQEQAQAAKALDQIKVADLGMQTLSLYLSTVAKLADDKSVNVSSLASSIASSLNKLGAVHSAVSAPASSLVDLLISAPLDVWRREAVGKLIDKSNASVLQLGNALASLGTLTADQYSLAILQANIHYGQLEVNANRQDREMLKEWRHLHVEAYEKAREQATAARTALLRIVKGQAALAAHKDELTGAELKALLSRYESDILGITNLLLPASASSAVGSRAT